MAYDLVNLTHWDAAQPVRSLSKQQWRIVGSDRVKMDAQRQHPFEDVKWRGDVLQPGFARPWTEAFDLDPLDHDDGPVLVPAEAPVHLGCLVEQDGANRACGDPKNARGDFADRTRRVKEIHKSRQGGQAHPRLFSRNGRKNGIQRVEFRSSEDGGNSNCAIAFKVLPNVGAGLGLHWITDSLSSRSRATVRVAPPPYPAVSVSPARTFSRSTSIGVRPRSDLKCQ